MQALDKAGMDCVVLGPDESKHGAVETHEEAKRCAELFQKNHERINGVIVSLPNFGDERAIADTLRLARLDVPVLVQATPDTPAKMTIASRRDSFCGKMSACNNLRQYGIHYSLTRLHTVSPDSDEFQKDWPGLPRCAAWSTDSAISVWAASGHVQRPSTRFATARNSWRPMGSRPRRSTCRRFWAASPAEGRSRRCARQTGGNPEVCGYRWRARFRADQDGEAWVT